VVPVALAAVVLLVDAVRPEAVVDSETAADVVDRSVDAADPGVALETVADVVVVVDSAAARLLAAAAGVVTRLLAFSPAGSGRV
jgi:hypothetical protein